MQDRESIWLLQAMGQDGHKSVAEDLLNLYPERATTSRLFKSGGSPGRKLSPEETRRARDELQSGSRNFPMRGEPAGYWCEKSNYFVQTNSEAAWRRADSHPTAYRAQDFMSECRSSAEVHLGSRLTELCLNPDLTESLVDPWYFQGLLDALRSYRAEFANRQPAGIAETSVCAEVQSEMDYASKVGGIVIIEGPHGIGKSFAARAACERRPGRFRLFKVASTNDRLAFYRPIAQSLGTPACLKAKAQEIQLRVDETLRTQDIVAVFDDAMQCWPNTNLRESMPDRIDWIVSLAEAGVPVVFITTPNFWERMEAIAGRGAWSPDAFMDRSRRIVLKSKLPFADFLNVARLRLPDSDEKTVQFLAGRASCYDVRRKNLRTLDRMILDTLVTAQQNGRACPTFHDAREAVVGITLPSDQSLIAAVKQKPKAKSKGSQGQGGSFAPVPQPARDTSAITAPKNFKRVTTLEATPMVT